MSQQSPGFPGSMDITALAPLLYVTPDGYRQAIMPFEPKHLNPVGLDLTAGTEALHISRGSKAMLAEGVPLVLYPGDVVVIYTHEHIRLPSNWFGFVGAKLDLVLQGLVQSPPIFIDFGYGQDSPSRLSLVFQNASTSPQEIQLGQKLCRIVLLGIQSAPMLTYKPKDRPALAYPEFHFRPNPGSADLKEAEARVSRPLYSLYTAMADTTNGLKKRLDEIAADRYARIAMLVALGSIALAAMGVFIAALKWFLEK